MYDVVSLGELLIDFTSVRTDADGYPTLEAHPGGAPANFLAALARFGAKTALLGKVGADAFGRLLASTLEKSGISAEGLILDPSVFTTLAFVTLDETGDREFSFARKPGADTQLGWNEVNTALIDEARVFHFGTLSLTDEPSRTACRKAVEYAKKAGKLITFDPNLRRPLWKIENDAQSEMLWGLSQADVVKLSDEEAEFLFGLAPEKAAEHILREFGVSLVFVTCGSGGCYFKNANACGWVPALSGIRPVDTTGAGDIFGGSAVWALLQTGKDPAALSRESLFPIVRFASAAAGLSTTRAGGISSIPSYEEVLSAMKQKKVPE